MKRFITGISILVIGLFLTAGVSAYAQPTATEVTKQVGEKKNEGKKKGKKVRKHGEKAEAEAAKTLK